jgi:WD40 repeat protein
LLTGGLLVSMVAACNSGEAPPNPYSLIRELSGHSGWIESVSWSPDGKLLASGSADGAVRIWNLDGGRTQEIAKEIGTVGAVAWSPDVRNLAIGSYGPVDTLRFWNIGTQTISLTVTPRGRLGIASLSWSPDGRVLALGGDDLILVEPTTGEVLTVPLRYGAANSARWSPDGNAIAYGSSLEKAVGKPYVVTIWDPSKGDGSDDDHNVVTMQGHSSFVNSVAWSPDGSRIVSGSYDETVRIWDVANAHEVATLTGHTQSVESVDWSPDGKVVASGGYDKKVLLWDVTTGDVIATLNHPSYVRSVVWSPDGAVLATACDDGKIRLWRTK